MASVAEELPFVAVVMDGKIGHTCSNCFAVSGEENWDKAVLKKCARCQTIRYCSEKCQREDWTHHRNECNYIVKAKHCPDEYTRFVIRVIMRMKRGDLPVAFNGRTFDDLKDHVDDIMATPRLTHYVNGLYRDLVRFMGAQNVPSKEEVISLYGKVSTNAIGIVNFFETVGRGLYIGLSAHKHSCKPECVLTFMGPKLTLRAQNPKAIYSTKLTRAYFDIASPKKDRQQYIQATYFFHCQCVRCLDEEEDLWERSGKASCCPDDGVVLPIDNGKPLICSKCKKENTLTLEQIDKANKELEIFCDTKATNFFQMNITSGQALRNFMKAFDDKEKILSPYNLYLLKMSEALRNVVNQFMFILDGCDDDTTLRFLHIDYKVLERYDPFSIRMIPTKYFVYKLAIRSLEARPNRLQYRKVIDAEKEILAAAKEMYDLEHPITKDVLNIVRDVEEKYKYLKRRH